MKSNWSSKEGTIPHLFLKERERDAVSELDAVGAKRLINMRACTLRQKDNIHELCEDDEPEETNRSKQYQQQTTVMVMKRSGHRRKGVNEPSLFDRHK